MDERNSERVVTDLPTEARIHRHSVAIFVYNLSQGGCMIEVLDASVTTGDNLRIGLGGYEHGGTVVWAHSGYAGVKFFRNLARELISFLGFKPSKISNQEVRPPDCFGRSLPALSTRCRSAGKVYCRLSS